MLEWLTVILLGSCDHKMARVDISAHVKVTSDKILVPSFKRAIFVKIRQILTAMQLSGDTYIEEVWLNFKKNHL